MSSSETSNKNNLNDIVNKADNVSQVLSLLSGEEIELAGKIYDKAENLNKTLKDLDELTKNGFSTIFKNIVGLNDSINKVLRDAIEMELMFQSKLDGLNDTSEQKQKSSIKTHLKNTSSSSDDEKKQDT